MAQDEAFGYLLPRIRRVMDEYGIDGFYNGLGYTNIASNPQPQAKDEVLAFKESTTHDGAMGDLLALIYAEVKHRGGTVKIHAGAFDALYDRHRDWVYKAISQEFIVRQ